MLTPQEVSTHAFAKASFGGYNMSMVDEFLDELTDDYTALYKENAALKAKMKVLVEKVEEYRATEDSMRATLLTRRALPGTRSSSTARKCGSARSASSRASWSLPALWLRAAACAKSRWPSWPSSPSFLWRRLLWWKLPLRR